MDGELCGLGREFGRHIHRKDTVSKHVLQFVALEQGVGGVDTVTIQRCFVSRKWNSHVLSSVFGIIGIRNEDLGSGARPSLLGTMWNR